MVRSWITGNREFGIQCPDRRLSASDLTQPRGCDVQRRWLDPFITGHSIYVRQTCPWSKISFPLWYRLFMPLTDWATRMNKVDGITAARSFVGTCYRHCMAALLCGSVARNEATLNSDLDILIVIEEEGPFHRKTYRHHGWFVEAFVAPQTFYEQKILQRGNNRNPPLLRSFAEAMILKDRTNFAQNLKEKAIETLKQGPPRLTMQERDQYRYIITDWLDDLTDSTAHAETLFIAAELIAKSAERKAAWSPHRTKGIELRHSVVCQDQSRILAILKKYSYRNDLPRFFG